MMKTSISNNRYFLAGLLFVFSLAVRMSLISKGPYNVDTLHIALQAERTLETGRMQYTFGVGYPGMVALSAVTLALCRLLSCGDPVFAVNLLTVVLSSACVAVFFDLANRLVSKTAAVFGSLLLSLSPLFLTLSVYGKSHIPAMLFFVLGCDLLAGAEDQKRALPVLGAGAAFGVMAAIRLQDFLLCLPAVGVLFFLYIHRSGGDARRGWRAFFAFLFAVIVVASFFYLPLLMRAEYYQQVRHYLDLGMKAKFLGLFSKNLVQTWGHLIRVLSFPGILLALIGLSLLFKQKRAVAGFLLAWILPPLFFYGNHRFIINPRFLVLFLPALTLSLAYGLSLLAEQGKTWWRTTVLVLLFLILWPLREVYPLLRFRHQHAVLPDFCRWVGRMTEQDAVIITSDERYMMTYYSDRAALTRPQSVFYAQGEQLNRFRTQVDDLLAQNIPVYITTAALVAYDREGHFSNFMKTHYRGEQIGKHLYEDWHLGGMTRQIFWFDLYRLHPKDGHL